MGSTRHHRLAVGLSAQLTASDGSIETTQGVVRSKVRVTQA